MLSRLERVPAAIREGAVYAMAIGLARITGVLLLPLLTRRLSDSELGVFGLLTSALLLLQYASGLGLDSAATRWFYEADVRGLTGDARAADRRRTLSTWVWTTMLVGLALSLIGALLAGPLARLAFDGTAGEIRATRAAALTIPALAMINVLQHWYRMVRRPIPALVVAAAVATSTFLLTIALVAVGHAGVAGVFAAQAIVGAGVTVAGLVQMWPVISPPQIDRAHLRTMLRYSVPLLPAVASPLLVGLLTRVLIRAFSDVDQVGKFQVVSMLATVVVLFTMAIQQAWEPFALSLLDRERAKPIYRSALLGFALLAAIACCALAALFPLALPILGSRFKDLALPALIFSAALLISGAAPIVNTGPSIVGTGRPALESMIAGTLTNVALCAALVPRFGQLGACWASLATAIVFVGLGIHRSERVWRVDFPIRAVLGVAVAAATICAALLTLADATTLPALVRVMGSVLLLLVTVGACLAALVRTTSTLRSRIV